MARSAWKGPFVDSHLLKKAEIVREKGSKEKAGAVIKSIFVMIPLFLLNKDFILERNNVGWNCPLLKSCLTNDQEFKNKFEEFYSEDLHFWMTLAQQRMN